jgi:anti-sigma factor RsiW
MVTQQLTCKEMVELVTEYLEGTLSRSDRRRFERHIVGCDGCSAYLDEMCQVVSVLGRLTEDSLSHEAKEALLHAFRDWKAS